MIIEWFKNGVKYFRKFEDQNETKVEEVKTVDDRIKDMSNKHAIYQWHEDIYMDINGYTYEVKRKEYKKV